MELNEIIERLDLLLTEKRNSVKIYKGLLCDTYSSYGYSLNPVSIKEDAENYLLNESDLTAKENMLDSLTLYLRARAELSGILSSVTLINKL